MWWAACAKLPVSASATKCPRLAAVTNIVMGTEIDKINEFEEAVAPPRWVSLLTKKV